MQVCEDASLVESSLHACMHDGQHACRGGPRQAARLVHAGDANVVVADRADDAGDMRAVPVLVQDVRRGRVRVEIGAVDVVDDAWRQSITACSSDALPNLECHQHVKTWQDMAHPSLHAGGHWAAGPVG